MRESKPILFATSMVRQLPPKGPKRLTRRLVAPSRSLVDGLVCGPKLWSELDFDNATVDAGPSPAGNPGPYLKVRRPSTDTVHRVYSRIQPGDLLWVRETWAHAHPVQIAEGRFSLPCTAGIPGPPSVKYRVIYKADGEYPPCYLRQSYPYRALTPKREDDTPEGRRFAAMESQGWMPSIHMRKEHARIWLDVTGVRVERLQDISEEDAKAEGADRNALVPSYRLGFEYLWGQINGAESWDANPWVWVVSFKRAERKAVAA